MNWTLPRFRKGSSSDISTLVRSVGRGCPTTTFISSESWPAHKRRFPECGRLQFPATYCFAIAMRSGRRPSALCCKYQELLVVVAFGLATIAGPFGGLCGTRKGAIAVRIITQRRLEFLQRLRGFIGFEQQLAEQFPDR